LTYKNIDIATLIDTNITKLTIKNERSFNEAKKFILKLNSRDKRRSKN